MSRRSNLRPDHQDNDYKYEVKIKRPSRSRSPIPDRTSYGITSESYRNQRSSNSNQRAPKTSVSSGCNRFIPDEEAKKHFEKPSGDETGFWTSEDYTFRDMLAKDIRDEIEDDIASKDSDEESEEDPEIAEYADRADMDEQEDDEQKKTIIERLIPVKKQDEKKIDVKLDQTQANKKVSS